MPVACGHKHVTSRSCFPSKLRQKRGDLIWANTELSKAVALSQIAHFIFFHYLCFHKSQSESSITWSSPLPKQSVHHSNWAVWLRVEKFKQDVLCTWLLDFMRKKNQRGRAKVCRTNAYKRWFAFCNISFAKCLHAQSEAHLRNGVIASTCGKCS